MGKNKVLVKVHPDGKYVVDLDPSIKIEGLKAGTRVALRNDSYQLHYVLPTKARPRLRDHARPRFCPMHRSHACPAHPSPFPQVDPLVSLMKVEKVPDSTYDMIGGLDKQIKELKEVIELPIKHPELFEALGVAQPKGVILHGPPGEGATVRRRSRESHSMACHVPVAHLHSRTPLRPLRHGQDAAGPRRGPPHRLYLHPRVGVGAGAKIHWGRVPHGEGAVRDGQGARPLHHLHGRD